jgi:formylglycine-generating enzyme required for sulfatase activity
MNRFLIVALFLCMQGISSSAVADSHKGEPKAGTEWTEPKTGMVFVWVPSGCFQMGGTDWGYQSPIHKVCVKGFWMGKYEVTQAQYLQMTGANPSRFKDVKNPVETVSFDDAANFSARMAETSGTKVRLPSEAEWEYACRAGQDQGRYCGNDANPNHLALYKGNSYGQARTVGHLAANDWGLHDMSGNVWEWVQDCWHDNFVGAPADGSEWKGGDCSQRVVRGGSWCNDESYSRASFRYGNDPDGGECSGFRVVRALR